jgi:DEAD/DEAH box helicase domain-containing protein
MSEQSVLGFEDDIIEIDEIEIVNKEDILSVKKIVYFDLETQNLFSDVDGGADQLLMSVGVLYIEPDNEYRVYTEENIQDMIEELFSADVVVGFNLIGFDYKVLTHYTDRNFNTIPTIDMMLDLIDIVKYWPKLDNVAKATLNEEKSADGLLAVKWWREGNMDDLIKYCTQDVEVTKNVYKYGEENKSVKIKNKNNDGIRQVDNVKWTERKK